MARIYISYARADKRFAEQLMRSLEKEKHENFGDLEKIQPGTAWREAIGQAMEDAEVVIVLWSSPSTKSDWVIREALFALENDKLLPLVIDDTRPPYPFNSLSSIQSSDPVEAARLVSRAISERKKTAKKKKMASRPDSQIILTVKENQRPYPDWQERLEVCLTRTGEGQNTKTGVRFIHYKPGFIESNFIFFPFLKKFVIRRFVRFIQMQTNFAGMSPDRFDIIAHGFGAYLVMEATTKAHEQFPARVHTLILAGAALSPHRSYSSLVGADGPVGRLVNDCGTRDWNLLNSLLRPGLGLAGRVGLIGGQNERFVNRYFNFGHGGYFKPSEWGDEDAFMKRWWVPLLTGSGKIELYDARSKTPSVVDRILRVFGEKEENATDQAAPGFAGKVSHALRQHIRSAYDSMRTTGAAALASIRATAASVRERAPYAAPAILVLIPLLLAMSVHFWTKSASIALVDPERTGDRAHLSALIDLRTSPDGAWIATASHDGTIKLWNAETGQLVGRPELRTAGGQTYDRPASGVGAMFFHSDNDETRWLSAIEPGENARIHTWEIEGRKLNGWVPEVQISRDAELATDFRAWSYGDPVNAQSLTHSTNPTDGFPSRATKAAAFLQGQSWNLLIAARNQILVESLASGRDQIGPRQEQRALPAKPEGRKSSGSNKGGGSSSTSQREARHEGRITALAILPQDGQSAEQNKGPPPPRPLNVNPDGTVRSPAPIVANQDSERLAVSVSHDGTVILWPLKDGLIGRGEGLRASSQTGLHGEVISLSNEAGRIISARFNEDSNGLAVATEGGFQQNWDVKNGTRPIADPERSIEDNNRYISVHLAQDRLLWVSEGNDNGSVEIRLGEQKQLIAQLRGHTASILSADVSLDGKLLVTASRDTTARIWDLETAKLLVILEGHTDRVNSASFSGDQKKVVTTSQDGTARIWDAVTGALVKQLEGHDDRVFNAVFSPDNKRVATASVDGTARVWDVQTGAQLSVLQGHEALVWSLSFNRDGSRLVTASGDETARIWDAVKGELLGILGGHDQEVIDAKFSPNGSLVLTVSLDSRVRVWRVDDIVSSTCGGCSTVAFSGNGQWLVTGGWGGSAQVWDVAKKKLHATIVHGKPINVSWLSDDGRLAITAGDDGTAKLWKIDQTPLSDDDEPRPAKLAGVVRGHGDLITHVRLNRDTTGALTGLITADLSGHVRVSHLGSAEWLGVLEPVRHFHAAYVWGSAEWIGEAYKGYVETPVLRTAAKGRLWFGLGATENQRDTQTIEDAEGVRFIEGAKNEFERKLPLSVGKEIQVALCVVSDGIFGPRTRAAIEEYQRTTGQKVTGTLDSAEQIAQLREMDCPTDPVLTKQLNGLDRKRTIKEQKALERARQFERDRRPTPDNPGGQLQ